MLYLWRLISPLLPEKYLKSHIYTCVSPKGGVLSAGLRGEWAGVAAAHFWASPPKYN